MEPNILTAIIATSIAVLLLANQFQKGQPYYSNGGRATYVKFVLLSAQDKLFHKITLMMHPTFDALVELLRDTPMRETAVRFRRGLFTVNRYFTEVLEALFILYPKYVKLDPQTCAQPSDLKDDPKYKAFKNAVGAVDGVLIMLESPQMNSHPGDAARAGWEGSTHNSRVYMDAYSKGLALPGNKYPTRNMAFKKVKLKKQVQLVYSLCMLWNFICKHEEFDPFEDQVDPDEVPSANSNSPLSQTAKCDSTPHRTNTQETTAMKLQQHHIATKLWDQYVSYNSRDA
ncbi:uncharacterized protein PGTG_21902 [Puccinia graminis f. sp. tritici CRL 75-36-700-3]|uniref:Uncharacterized protein n=1 Tax=Puccinia graminis f. sp. tritici (strain CRL 75-36-700-3 / race SCCL) TaxID=418459 RepID=H6QTD3_PUCGT|nr:uncharacterized protein PGTG_21902 [Puccinia graminis f. sp. tritici CRL 75-36-700-3]EHS64152.1 hypothetical protein PGTG_21902 [Puccinia graminis f. sp. tritici CRL 75-36-700-3]